MPRVKSKYLPVALASSSRQPGFSLTEKSLGNVPFLESLRLLEMRKGKIFKNKQKTEYVKANTATFYKQHSKADLFKRSRCLSEYSRGY